MFVLRIRFRYKSTVLPAIKEIIFENWMGAVPSLGEYVSTDNDSLTGTVDSVEWYLDCKEVFVSVKTSYDKED